jgi:transglutaminase-like putative cysteine protease
MEDLSIYLKPTYYIDSESPSIRLLSRKLTTPYLHETVGALFYFVRDEITYNPYSLFYLPEHYPADRTLERGEGYCIQKAVLLAALARACNIPARLVFADITNHLMPPKLWKMMETNLFYHGYNELYLDGRWIRVTPTFDKGMCERLNLMPVEFDGRHPAIFHSHDRQGRLHIEYTKDHGHCADLPFEKLMGVFTRYYTKQTLDSWKAAGIEAQKRDRC